MVHWAAMGAALIALTACDGSGKEAASVVESGAPMPLTEDVLSTTSATRMKGLVDALADDAMGGRVTGSPGHLMAMNLIVEEMAAIGLEPIGMEGDFVYPYPATPRDDFYQVNSDGSISIAHAEVAYDIVGRLEGSNPEKSHEHILVMAHYDHLGVDETGDVFNGAFDNAAGVAVALELARVLIEQPPERSVVFLISDEEESGLDGARVWLADSTVPREQIVYGFSVDPVGRPSLPDYWPTLIIGAERSPELLESWRSMSEWNDLPTVFLNRDLVPVFASDQDELYKLDPPIPGFWFVNPGFSFYHTVDDAAETIDYRIMKADVRFLANALTSSAAADIDYSFDADVPLDGEAARGVQDMILGLKSSGFLNVSEREYADFVLELVDQAIEADDLNAVGNLEAFSVAVAYFVMFDLGASHPGPIPPPFPEE